jgi:hypothetical protein
MKSHDDLAAGAAMVKRIRVFMIPIAVLIAAGVGASFILFDKPVKILFYLANLNPLSTIVNSIQLFGIPSNDAACLKSLKTRDVEFKSISDFTNPKGCSVTHAVRLVRVGKVKIDNAPLLTCRMASQLADFEEGALQTSAQRLLGTRVTRIKHFGSYNCRGMRKLKNILSQHAFANAIDVSGFELNNGQSVSIEKDWNADTAKSTFLKEIAGAACRTFRVSVSPYGDANHWDHFHWDTGFLRSCR